MSDRDLVQELKSNIVDLTQDRDDALAKVKSYNFIRSKQSSI